MAQGWLFTVEAWQSPAQPGEAWELWTEPPVDHRTGAVRRRVSDGQPYTPAWKPEDGIVMFHPASDRCVALLEVTSLPRWDSTAELFYLDTRVEAWNEHAGPTLAAIGVEKALQGGRHRLTMAQYRAARTSFNRA